MSQNRSPAQRAIRRHLLAGVTAVTILAGGVGGLAATTEISGAVIAAGSARR
jgi:HlyD family secretion protein